MDYKELSGVLLDVLGDLYGVKNSARILIEAGYGYDDLIELDYDTDVIEEAMTEDMLGKEYDLG